MTLAPSGLHEPDLRAWLFVRAVVVVIKCNFQTVLLAAMRSSLAPTAIDKIQLGVDTVNRAHGVMNCDLTESGNFFLCWKGTAPNSEGVAIS
jgi:hypothetical protein